jgi:hypothetical protein
VEKEKEHLLSMLPIWEARQEAAAELAKIVKLANASEAVLQHMQHTTGHMLEDGSTRSSSSMSDISTPGSQSSTGSSQAGSFAEHNSVQDALVDGMPSAADHRCSRKSSSDPVASNSRLRDTPVVPLVATSDQEAPLPAGNSNSSEQDVGSSSEEGPATPGGSHSGSDDNTFLPKADSSNLNNNNQKSPVASSAIVSSTVSAAQQLPLLPTLNQVALVDPEGAAADCALGHDQAPLQHHAPGDSTSINNIKAGSSNGGSSLSSSELLAAAQHLPASSILSSHPLDLNFSNAGDSSSLTSHPLELFCDNFQAGLAAAGAAVAFNSSLSSHPLTGVDDSKAGSSLTSYPLELFSDNSKGQVTAVGIAAAGDINLSSNPLFGCHDLEAGSSLASHSLESFCDNSEAGMVAATATDSSMVRSSLVNSMVDCKVAAQPEEPNRASCRPFGVRIAVCRLLRL